MDSIKVFIGILANIYSKRMQQHDRIGVLMVDFSKRLKGKPVPKKIHPIEIYDSLDRRIETGPLRPSQVAILNDWYSQRKIDRNVIIKLHTGEGKTLIGLLILQSKINSGEGPCLYVCPNKYLVDQVREEAEKFGVPYVDVSRYNRLPDDFNSGTKILITHVQKLFNGKTIFGLDNQSIQVGAIVIDDSHACIDSIRNALTIRVGTEHNLYKTVMKLFSDDIREQGEGSFLEIDSGEYSTMLPIPYWSWYNKSSEVTRAILDSKSDNDIKFAWPVLKDHIEDCHAFISGKILEISPTLIPIDVFGSYSKANNRILMSATTQDDSFFIKGLGFTTASIKNPLIHEEQMWSGEKMILIPSLIDENLNRNTVVTWLSQPNEKRTYGVVSITPSFRYNEQYRVIGAVVASTDDIFTQVKKLKEGNCHEAIVFVNRYDGIDLPDKSCRILVLDSKPYFHTLVDRYEEICRSSSDIINIRIAQKVEQGLGRSVRGEKDYSIIVLVGNSLVDFVKNPLTNKYFSRQTKKQIDIGMQIARFAVEESIGENPLNILVGLMKQALERDEGWKEYYLEEMSSIQNGIEPSEIHKLLQKEYEAEKCFVMGNISEACNKLQQLCDNDINDESEKGWYLQQIARYKYRTSKTESNRLQKAAFLKNNQLLKPIDGIEYKKIEYVNESRTTRIREWISKFDSYEEMILSIDSILQNLSFGMPHEKFESALKEIGEAIGFIAQRPDNEIKKGPDVLWCGVENHYFLFECKSEVLDSRKEISKHEAGQMNSHSAWFDSVYPGAKCIRILIIPIKTLSYQGDFTHEVKIMRKGTLRKFKQNVKRMFKEYERYQLNDISDEKVQEIINIHEMDIINLLSKYIEPYRRSMNRH